MRIDVLNTMVALVLRYRYFVIRYLAKSCRMPALPVCGDLQKLFANYFLQNKDSTKPRTPSCSTRQCASNDAIICNDK